MAVRPGLAGVLAPTHGHLGTVGFMLSMVMGVAFWMMPRPGGMRQTGYEAVTFALLQAGMAARVVGEPWWRLTGDPMPHALFAVSGALTFAATVSFALAMSRRFVTVEAIRAAARPPRHARAAGLAPDGPYSATSMTFVPASVSPSLRPSGSVKTRTSSMMPSTAAAISAGM